MNLKLKENHPKMEEDRVSYRNTEAKITPILVPGVLGQRPGYWGFPRDQV